MTHKSYAVVQNPRTKTTRLSWSSEGGEAMYCGICLRGLVKAEIGHVCPSCQSQVNRVFEVFKGGRLAHTPGARRSTAADRSMAGPFAKANSL